MIVIPLPERTFQNGEEHFPIDHFFEDGCEYEMAVLGIAYPKRLTNIVSLSTNIIEYDVFNPKQIIYTLSPPTQGRISFPIYYKISVSSLQNFRIKIFSSSQQPFIITVGIRKANGKTEI